ncbi:hypothetical protein E2C01_039621 [Portunus trituberculatus]|uniref:Uncharacterized protein n=1 Tax=Portunus trituberculatus TaxID=210409 RepID=A0A5B7FKB7_PORTR|nr:hypothetical protein [Portunus trituberculatus]
MVTLPIPLHLHLPSPLPSYPRRRQEGNASLLGQVISGSLRGELDKDDGYHNGGDVFFHSAGRLRLLPPRGSQSPPSPPPPPSTHREGLGVPVIVLKAVRVTVIDLFGCGTIATASHRAVMEPV